MAQATARMSAAAQTAAKVKRARRRFFRLDDFNGPRAAVDRALCRLVEAGELRRVRNGLYWRGPKTALGMTLPTEEELLAELVGRIGVYGPAGHSAANALGLTTQVPGRTHVAVTGRAPRDVAWLHFVERAGRSCRNTAKLRPAEVALLEVLDDFDNLVDDHHHALRRMQELVQDGAVRRTALEAALATEPARVRKPLAALLADDIAAAHRGLVGA